MQGIEQDKCVLVAEDDRATLMLLERHLQSSGYRVLTASNGAEAMRVLLAHGPQIVVTDWMMPEMDGLELCRAIREHEGAGFVYTIILTALSDEDRLVEAFDAGADDFLVKPFNRKELLARIRAGDRIVRLEHDLAARTREMHLQNAQLAIVNDKLNTMAITDELTGLFNRRAAMDRLRDHWAGSSRHGQPLTCISLDIDHFKAINDAHGHDFGDVVLREVANVLLNTVRVGESCCRVGGEEFLVICPSTTAEMGGRAAERLRAAVERREIRHHNTVLGVTMSLGVAERVVGMEAMDDMLKAADEALYTAKRSGRNRVQLVGAPAPESILMAHAQAGKSDLADATRISVVHDDAVRDSVVLTLKKLAEYRDNDTGEHVDHVTHYCMLLADTLRSTPDFSRTIDAAFIRELGHAAPLHDLGKIGIPDSILLKPGRLTPEEMAVMRRHCQIGADCIRSVMSRTPGAGFLSMALEIAAAHHEWFDGSGYPAGLSGDEIPLAARIAALADVYDALRMKRPYKSAMTHEQARDIIAQGSGKQFDPRMVKAFLEREAEFSSLMSRNTIKPAAPVKPPLALTARVETIQIGRVRLH